MEKSRTNEQKAMENLLEEADFLERNFSGCLERYAYGPVVAAMREGALVIEKLLVQMKD